MHYYMKSLPILEAMRMLKIASMRGMFENLLHQAVRAESINQSQIFNSFQLLSNEHFLYIKSNISCDLNNTDYNVFLLLYQNMPGKV